MLELEVGIEMLGVGLVTGKLEKVFESSLFVDDYCPCERILDGEISSFMLKSANCANQSIFFCPLYFTTVSINK